MGTLDEIGRHLVLAVKPLKDAVATPDSFRQFIYRLGWSATGVPPQYFDLIAKVDGAVTELAGLGTNPSLDKVIRLLGRIKELFEAIRDISVAPPGVVDVPAFLNEIKDRLFEILITDYLSAAQPLVYNLLKALGVIEPVHIASTPDRPSIIRFKINWDAIPEIITDPVQIFERVFGWGTDNLKFEVIAQYLLELAHAIGAPVSLRKVDPDLGFKLLGNNNPDPFDTPVQLAVVIPFTYFNIGGTSKEIGVRILDLPKEGPKLPGIIIQPEIPSEIGAELRVREDLYFRIKGGSNIGSMFGIVIRPGEISVVYPFQDGQLPDFGFAVGADYKPEAPKVMLGSADATRLQMKEASFDFGFRFTAGQPEVMLGFELKGLALILKAGESDGFIKKILGDGEAKLDLPLGIEWSSVSGIKFKGGGGFEVALAPHISLGPISIEQMKIRLTADINPPPKLKLEIGADIKGDLGPLQFVVQGIGLSLGMEFRNNGNAGPFDISLGFKPPNGIGLSVDTGVITGGGFLYLDFDKGEYMGALELEFKNMFSLKAIGIINTKMPDGSSGFSLLIIITAEFTPIQLGFGFTLNGVGGLLGLNRTTKVEVLREGVKTNALKSILFPEDVVANINRIVSDLKQVFPVMQGHFIIGPMAKIGWASIVTLELGLLIELPEPRIIILGVLKAVLPAEDAPLLKLQVNFLGVIDFGNKYISFDASLYDSRLLLFTLTGDMALRISWGSPALFILSVGGFHPAFKDVPADLKGMKRLSISLLSGDNPRIGIEAYFAVTSNTVQFGAKAELYAEACGFNVWGYIGFDVLFQFDPFYFIASIYAGLALRSGTTVLLGIKLRGELSGPTPWNVNGEASFTILFFEISVGFDVTWGDDPDELPKETINVLEELKKQLMDSRNWKAEIPSNNSLFVSIKKYEPPEGEIVIHPFGVLSFNETLVPLDIAIDKFGSKKPEGDKKFALSDIKSGSIPLSSQKIKDRFAPAQFLEMKDSEKISRPSFEMLNSGFSVTASAQLNIASPVEKKVDYEVAYLRKKRFSLFFAGILTYGRAIFDFMIRAGAVSQSPMSIANKIAVNAPEEVKINTEEFVIANVSNMSPYAENLRAGSQAEAYSMYNSLISSNPSLKGKVQVLSTFELNN